jgi:ferritin
MAVSNADKQLLKLIKQLNDSQKRSLTNFIKSFISKQISERQSIEEYNIEIDRAIENAKKGNFTTFEDLEKEMESW